MPSNDNARREGHVSIVSAKRGSQRNCNCSILRRWQMHGRERSGHSGTTQNCMGLCVCALPTTNHAFATVFVAAVSVNFLRDESTISCRLLRSINLMSLNGITPVDHEPRGTNRGVKKCGILGSILGSMLDGREGSCNLCMNMCHLHFVPPQGNTARSNNMMNTTEGYCKQRMYQSSSTP